MYFDSTGIYVRNAEDGDYEWMAAPILATTLAVDLIV